MPDLDALTIDDFSALKGARFRITPADGAPFEAELAEVTAIDREPGGRAPFSLVFEGGPVAPYPQGIAHVEHDALGVFDIFLVPVGPARYEAVFT